MDIQNQTELERKAKLKALKNYELSENYDNLKKEAESRKEKCEATLVTAYLSPSEDGEIFTEMKKYNHKNKFAWGIEEMSEFMDLVDDSEGGKIIKDEIQKRIDISKEHIGLAMVKIFPGSGGMVEYRYTDVEFTDSDRIVYEKDVAADVVKLVDQLIEQYSKESESDIDGGTDEEPEEATNTNVDESESE